MWQPTHVKVTVKQAKGILTKGKNGTNDAFVVIGIGKEKYQTSIKEKSSSSVEWREECELAIPSQGNKAMVQLTVYHHNTLGIDEFLGQIGLPLSDFDVYEKPKYRSYRLKGKPDKDKKKGEKDRGELEIMINFTVKSGSFLDISKKEKQKSSLTSLKHLGGSLMSIGGKDKREGLKNFAKSVSSKMDKITKPKRRKSKTPSENSSTGFSNDLMSSQQRYGDADPGVISDDDDDDFKFDDDVKVSTRTSSPLSTMSRGSSLMHDQVLDTDYEVGSYEDPEHDFSYSFGKSSAKPPPPLIVDETKESLSAPLDLERQAMITHNKVTSFSNPNPLVRITPNAPDIVETIIEEEPSFEKRDLSDSESIDDVKPVGNRDNHFVNHYGGGDDDDKYQNQGPIDLGPPIELPTKVFLKQDDPLPISSSYEVIDAKTKKDSPSNSVFRKQDDHPKPISTTYEVVETMAQKDSLSNNVFLKKDDTLPISAYEVLDTKTKKDSLLNNVFLKKDDTLHEVLDTKKKKDSLSNNVFLKKDDTLPISSYEVLDTKTKKDSSSNKEFWKQDDPSPISTSYEVIEKTKKGPQTNKVFWKQDEEPSSISTSYEGENLKPKNDSISFVKNIEINPSPISTSHEGEDRKTKEDVISSAKNNKVNNSRHSTYYSTTNNVNNENGQKKNTDGYKFEIDNTVDYIELETAKSDVVETKGFEKMNFKNSSPPETAKLDIVDTKFETYSSVKMNDFEKIHSKFSPRSHMRDEFVNVEEKMDSTLDSSKNNSYDNKIISQRKLNDEMKPKILDENVRLRRESRDGRDSAISLSQDPDSIISSRPRSSSNASSVVSSASTGSVHVDKDAKDAHLKEAITTTSSAQQLSKPLFKSSSDLDVLLRRKNSTGRSDGKRVISAVDFSFSGDLEENQMVRSGSLTERRPSAIAATVAASADRIISTPPRTPPPIAIDEWERKLYGRSGSGITGSVDNVSMTGSRSSLNTSRESSIHDIKKGDSFTRLPEVKALTLEKMTITAEDDDAKKQKRKQKTGFKNRFFSKPENRDRPNEDSRIVEGGNDRLPSIPSRPSKLPQEIHDKFAGKSREDLLEIILNLQSTLEKQVKHSNELEEYIDNLLLRVMEATPHILQSPITTGPSIKGY